MLTDPATGSRVPTAITSTSASLPHLVRRKIFLYLGILIVLLAFGAPGSGLIDIPITFLLKNKMHLKAHELADFRLVAGIPLYLSFVFGLIRDSCNPLGMRDRGFMLLFGSATAGLYIIFAFTPLTYGTLLVAVVILTASFLCVASALNGLTSTLGQQHVMSGQISAIWNTFASIPTVAALLVGGSLSNMLEEKNADQAVRILFLIGAAIMAAIAAYALWKPRSVFDNVRYEHGKVRYPLDDIRRMVRHWPIYPALLIWLLWNFAPGSATASILSSEFTQCDRCAVGSVERHLCGLVHPDLYAIRSSMPKASAEDPAVMGNSDRTPTNGAVALHPFNWRSTSRGGANRAHGRCCYCCLYGPDHPVLSFGTARYNAHDGRRTQHNRGAIWRCLGHEPL
jgi:hypothetical protein